VIQMITSEVLHCSRVDRRTSDGAIAHQVLDNAAVNALSKEEGGAVTVITMRSIGNLPPEINQIDGVLRTVWPRYLSLVETKPEDATANPAQTKEIEIPIMSRTLRLSEEGDQVETLSIVSISSASGKLYQFQLEAATKVSAKSSPTDNLPQ